MLLMLPRMANAGVVLLIAGATGLAWLRPSRRLPLDLSRALLAFSMSSLASHLSAGSMSERASLLLPFAPGVLLLLAIGRHATLADLRMLLRVLCVIAAALGIEMVVKVRGASPLDEALDAMATTVIVEPNDVCFLVLLIPAAFALLKTSDRSGDTVLAGVTVVVTLAATVAVRSRLGTAGAVLGILASTAVLSGGSRRVLMALLGAAVLVAIADSLDGFALCRKVLETTWFTRVPPWAVAVQMFRDAPWVGHGPRSYGLLFDQYYLDLDLSGWMEPRHTPWAHSLPLETLAEQGTIGMATLLIVVRAVYRCASAHPVRGDGRTYSQAASIALGLFVFVGLFEASFVRLWVVLSAAVWIGVACATRTPDESVVPDPARAMTRDLAR